MSISSTYHTTLIPGKGIIKINVVRQLTVLVVVEENIMSTTIWSERKGWILEVNKVWDDFKTQDMSENTEWIRSSLFWQILWRGKHVYLNHAVLSNFVKWSWILVSTDSYINKYKWSREDLVRNMCYISYLTHSVKPYSLINLGLVHLNISALLYCINVICSPSHSRSV